MEKLYLSDYVKNFIEKNIHIIDDDSESSWLEFYDKLQHDPGLFDNKGYGAVTEALHACDIFPLNALSYVPDLFQYGGTIDTFIVPAWIKSLGKHSFAFCRNLKSIELPENLKYIGRLAFDGCVNLSTIYIPDSVQYLSDNVFMGCSNLIKIHLGSGLKEIGVSTLRCKNLKEIIYNGSIEDWNKIKINRYPRESWKCRALRKIICLDGVIKL